MRFIAARPNPPFCRYLLAFKICAPRMRKSLSFLSIRGNNRRYLRRLKLSVVAYFQFWIEYSIIGSSSRRKRNCSIWDLCVIIISFFSVFSFELKLWIWMHMFLDRDIRRDFSIIFNNFVGDLASFKVS